VAAVTGCFAVASNDPVRPSVTVAVSGRGVPVPKPVLALAPAALDFGEVLVGAATAASVTVTNAGNAPLEVGAVAACAGTSPDFSASAAAFTVAPGTSQELVVTFAPTLAGASTGCIALSTNDPAAASATVQVAGAGRAPPAPAMSVEPATLAFGSVRRESSKVLYATVRNAGTAELAVSAIARCAGTSREFAFSSAPFTVAPGASRRVYVAYRPADRGSDLGCVVLTTNDATAPSFALTLTGSSGSYRD
jgi:hypothetical protein